MNCPYCQAQLNVTEQPGGQPAVCPHCLSNLADPRSTTAGMTPNVLRDIRQPEFSAYWTTLLLLGLAIGATIVVIVLNRSNSGDWVGRLICNAPLFILLYLLAVPVVIMTVYKLFSSGQTVIVAWAVTAVVLTIGLLAAIVICFYTVCPAVM
jgi:hypothetical protein